MCFFIYRIRRLNNVIMVKKLIAPSGQYVGKKAKSITPACRRYATYVWYRWHIGNLMLSFTDILPL